MTVVTSGSTRVDALVSIVLNSTWLEKAVILGSVLIVLTLFSLFLLIHLLKGFNYVGHHIFFSHIFLPHGNRLNDNIIPLIHSLNKVSFNVNSDDNAESLNSSNCNYYKCKDFTTAMSSTHCHNISSFHLNISSISKHFDKLISLLSLLQCNFSFIGISETRLIKDREPVLDFSLPSYSNVSTPTESSAGGVLLYISNSFAFKPRHDLDSCFYLAKSLESIFVEILNLESIFVEILINPT